MTRQWCRWPQVRTEGQGETGGPEDGPIGVPEGGPEGGAKGAPDVRGDAGGRERLEDLFP